MSPFSTISIATTRVQLTWTQVLLPSFFLPCYTACCFQTGNQRLNLGPQQRRGRVLTTGLLGNSQVFLAFNCYLYYACPPSLQCFINLNARVIILKQKSDHVRTCSKPFSGFLFHSHKSQSPYRWPRGPWMMTPLRLFSPLLSRPQTLLPEISPAHQEFSGSLR